jgi:formyl-CoA transferase
MSSTAGAADPGAGALAGVRVLELGSLIAGPFATRLLGDLGAEIIKVEAPGRLDPMREWGAVKYHGRSLWWPVQSRGKKLITLDLASERGQQLGRDLAARCDVLIENFRPGTMERWGLGPDRLLEINPRLIYTRVSGYGQTGPYSHRPGFASAGEALAGMRHLNGFPGGPPPRTGLSLGDSLCAMFAAIGTLAALHQRDVSGHGQVVDASIVESCFALLESVAPEYDKLGVVRGPTGTTIANNAPSNLYRSKDDKWMIVAANSANLWPRLCRAIGREDLLTDSRFSTHDDRGRHMEDLDGIIGTWTAERDATEIEQLLTAAGVVCAPVFTIADIFKDPHVKAREMLVSIDASSAPEMGQVIGPGVVPKMSASTGPREFTAAWTPGEHNSEIYCNLLDVEPEMLETLTQEGVI